MSRRTLLVSVTIILAATVLLVTAARAEPPVPAPPINARTTLPLMPIRQAFSVAPAQIAAPDIIPWSKIVFQSFRNMNWDIYSGDDTGGGQQQLTDSGRSEIHPSLKPGGDRIAYSYYASNKSYEIYVMNADGSGKTALTTNTTDDVFPTWSPDGSQLAFQAYRDGQPEIYVMNAGGGGIRRLTNHPGYDGYPTWSPDGSQIAFISSRSGEFYVYVMNADGSGVRQLSTRRSSVFPRWSPDGRQIAFSADQDTDDWLELWTIDVDGSNEMLRVDPSGARDAWAGSWSPDNRYIAYTNLTFVYYQGNWYWSDAYLRAYDTITGSVVTLSQNGLDWNVDWRTLDTLPPVSSLAPLPGTSPAPVQVSWSGTDSGGAGVARYDVQVRVGGGGWTDWLVATDASSGAYPGVGGDALQFRVRAHDRAFNSEVWPANAQASTTVEALPPRPAITPLPPFQRADLPFTVSWSGSDPGSSGIASFDVQSQLNGGAWSSWQTGTSQTSALWTAPTLPGDTLAFRVRAVDRAQNWSDWTTVSPAATTTMYAWGIAGATHDNAGAPVSGITISSTAALLATLADDVDGAYAGYFLDQLPAYALTWSKSGYGAPPVTSFGAATDAAVDVALPPANNLIREGEFETHPLPLDWTTGGLAPPIVTDTQRHTGGSAALLGAIETFGTTLLATNPMGSQFFHLAAGDDGSLHALWLTGGTTWQHSSRPPDGTWQPPDTLVPAPNCLPDELHSRSTIRVRADGTVQFAWSATSSRYIDEAICYAERSPGAGWGPVDRYVPPDPPGVTEVRIMRFMLDETGKLHLSWQHETADWKRRSYYVFRAPGGGWSAVALVAEYLNVSTNRFLTAPDMAVEPSGKVHFVWPEWQYTPQRESDLFYRSRLPDGTWSATEQFTFTPSAIRLPIKGVAGFEVDSAGRLHVMWEEELEGGPFYIQRSAAGWSGETSFGGNEYHVVPVMVVGPDDTVYIAWVDERELFVAVGQNGQPNFDVVSLTTTASWSQELLTDVGSDGRFHLSWIEWNGNTPGSHYQARDQDGTWSAVVTAPVGNADWYQAFQVDGNGWPFFLGAGAPEFSVYAAGPHVSAAGDDIRLTQTISIPATMDDPVLSFFYRYGGFMADARSQFEVLLDDGQPTTLFAQNNHTAAWRHQWLDLSAWRGQTVDVTFRLHQGAAAATMHAYVDDVTLGTAYPDVWVQLDGGSGIPGQTIQQALHVGNRGGGLAAGSVLTLTLPAELRFVSASPPPVSTAPLVWQLGDLAAGSGPISIDLTLTVSDTAVAFSTLTPLAAVRTTTTEPEQLNNLAIGRFFVGRYSFLPLAVRP